MSDATRTKLGAQVERGDRARKILEDPLVAEAFAAVEREIVERWRTTEGADVDTREKAYLMQRLLGNLRGQFEAHVKTGELATKQLWALEEEQTLRQRMTRKVRRGQ